MDEQSAEKSSRLETQVALVTGGGRGIGRAIAQAPAAAGAVVAVVARSADELAETVRLIEHSGGRSLALPVDVTDPQKLRNAVSTIEQSLGPVMCWSTMLEP
jgi:3-oxoacyl-[acyl-carrier protein] reductase